jgi:hypothetical protein
MKIISSDMDISGYYAGVKIFSRRVVAEEDGKRQEYRVHILAARNTFMAYVWKVDYHEEGDAESGPDLDVDYHGLEGIEVRKVWHDGCMEEVMSEYRSRSFDQCPCCGAISEWEHDMCPDCMNKTVKCELCGDPVDGRNICGLCREKENENDCPTLDEALRDASS